MKNFALLLALAFAISTQAQNIVYELTTLNSPYSNLVNPTIVSPEEPWDDIAPSIPVGFPFELYGQVSDTLIMGDLSQLLLNGEDPYMGDLDAIVPHFIDPVDRGYDGEESLSDIGYEVSGAEGNRIFKLQWRNVGFFGDSAFVNFTNFQLWLYEADNVIESRFGPNSNPPISLMENSGSLLLRDLSNNTAGIMQYTIGMEDEPILFNTTNIDSFYETGMLDANPADGRVYRFTPGLEMSVEENAADAGLKVFPTVIDQWLTLELKNSNTQVAKILDLSGKNLKQFTVRPGQNQLDLSDLSQGLYLLTVEMNGQIETVRIVKQ